MVRPSFSSIRNTSLETCTPVALTSTSVFEVGEVAIPSLQQPLEVLRHEAQYLTEFTLRVAVVVRDSDRSQPDFRPVAVPQYVHVRRLDTVRRIEPEEMGART